MDINQYQDVMDTRDILKLIEERTSEDGDEPESDLDGEIDQDRRKELAELQELVSEIRQYGGDSPEDGVQLIRYSYFEAYARELAEDTAPYGPGDEVTKILNSWPYRCIDWEEAAEELRQDYTEIEFRGVSYYIR